MIVISGGQTGVDRAGLDAAILHDIPVMGMVPKDWRTEDSTENADELRNRYPSLLESMSTSYPPRTNWNVKHADFVILFTSDGIRHHRGTLLTAKIASNNHIPYAVVHLDDKESRSRAYEAIRAIMRHKPDDYKVMIAGCRESGDRGIYHKTYEFLAQALDTHEEP